MTSILWRLRARTGLLACAVLLIFPLTPSHAAGPEQFYEPAPGKGQTRVEYNGQFGNTSVAERSHSLELFHGLAEGVALGVELEAEAAKGDFNAEELGVGALFDLAGKEEGFKLAMLVQAGVTTEGDFPQIEARLIGEQEVAEFDLLANLILRRQNADEEGAALAYALLAEREVTETLSLGFELSGQAARLQGYDNGFEKAHYAGPSVTVSWPTEGGEFGLGLKYLRRIAGDEGSRSTVRLVAGATF